MPSVKSLDNRRPTLSGRANWDIFLRDIRDIEGSVITDIRDIALLVHVRNVRQRPLVVVVDSEVLGKTIHVILEVTDDGQPPLTRYRRVVLKGRAVRD